MPANSNPSEDRAVVVKQALLVAALGLVLVWTAGFSQNRILHNAAHDVRHADGFPCH